MNKYIVQARFTHGGHLVSLGVFTARTSTNAIMQAGRVLQRLGDEVVSIVATENK